MYFSLALKCFQILLCLVEFVKFLANCKKGGIFLWRFLISEWIAAKQMATVSQKRGGR